MYHGKGTSIDQQGLSHYDVVFTSYETVFSDSTRSKSLQEMPWFRIVLDEGTL